MTNTRDKEWIPWSPRQSQQSEGQWPLPPIETVSGARDKLTRSALRIPNGQPKVSAANLFPEALRVEENVDLHGT